MKLVLASSSPRRRELIQMLGIPCEAIANDVDETVAPGLTPREIVEELSLRKAKAAFPHGVEEGVIVVGSDTIVAVGDQALGKPKDDRDAFAMLHLLQGRAHEVYTGVTCLSGSRIVTQSRLTKVSIKPLTDDKIWSYIKTGEPADKAGSYAAQGIGATLVEAIEGDHFNVVGLPLSMLADMLEQFGVRVL
jgi:septum formation protein